MKTVADTIFSSGAEEECVAQHKLNAQFATVGNCCVKKFIGLPSELIFQAVKRVRKDNQKSLNAGAIQHAHEKGWINKWEYKFSIDTMRKRNLSAKQLQTRMKVNEKMLEQEGGQARLGRRASPPAATR